MTIKSKNFSSPQVYPSNTPLGPYETPINYCASQGGIIKQSPSIADPGTIYWWLVNDPNGNPASGISISPIYTTNPNANISFSNYSFSTATIIAKALDNGCDGASDGSWNQIYTINVNQSCRSANTNSLKSSINNTLIFPNPTTSQSIVKSDEAITEIEIFDINKTISYMKRKYAGSNNVTLEVSTLKPGIYICKVVTKTKTEFLKLQVTK